MGNRAKEVLTDLEMPEGDSRIQVDLRQMGHHLREIEMEEVILATNQTNIQTVQKLWKDGGL